MSDPNTTSSEREALRAALGDALVDAPPELCWLAGADGLLSEARLRGNTIPQHLMWLAERPQAALRTLVLEQSSMFNFEPLIPLLANLEAPALSTLVFGPPAGAGARFTWLKALPKEVLRDLEHLSIQARVQPELLDQLGGARKLRTLTLEVEPKNTPLDLGPLAAALGSMEHLTELFLSGPFDAASAEALVAEAPASLEHLEVDCVGGPRLVRTTPERAALREAMGSRPEATDWWTGDLPPGTRLSESTAGGRTTYAAELPNTRVLGRRTERSPDHRTDQQLWFGRLQGVQVTERGTQTVVQLFDRGVQQQMEIYEGGALTERRSFKDGKVARKKSFKAPPPKPPSAAPYEGDFKGRSTELLEVVESQTWASPDAVPDAFAAILVQEYGPHTKARTLPAVFELTDKGAFVAHRCKVRATGEELWVLTAHFGDTLAGVGVQGGRLVAKLNDGHLAPVA